MQGRDPCDSTSVGIEGGIEAPSREDLSGLRFAVPAELAQDAIEAGVRAVFEATLKRIEELAARSPRWRCRTPSTASPPTT